MVQGVFSSNLTEQYEATQKFRKLLSIGELLDRRLSWRDWELSKADPNAAPWIHRPRRPHQNAAQTPLRLCPSQSATRRLRK